MKLLPCTFDQAPAILDIFNDAILHSTALYEYKPRTMATMEAWFEAKRKGNLPVIGAFDDDGRLAGFSSYGPFRPHPAYQYSVEHSVYVEKSRRGRGVGRQLLEAVVAEAQRQQYHMLVGGIDSANTASIRLHEKLGFTHCATIREAGYKFGKWLDLVFYQRILPTPDAPREG